MTRNYDTNNIFAKIIKGNAQCTKVFEDNNVLAIRDISPRAPQHILALPKGQYIDLTDFIDNASDADIATYFRAIVKIAKEVGIDKSGYRIISNVGIDGCQEVPHFHTHILGGCKMND